MYLEQKSMYIWICTLILKVIVNSISEPCKDLYEKSKNGGKYHPTSWFNQGFIQSAIVPWNKSESFVQRKKSNEKHSAWKLNCAWWTTFATYPFNICLCKCLTKYHSTHPRSRNTYSFQCILLNCVNVLVPWILLNSVAWLPSRIKTNVF